MPHRTSFLLPLLFAFLLEPVGAQGDMLQTSDRPGDLYEIRLTRDQQTSGDRSSGSSHDVWTLVERVVALRDGGVELEFDLPTNVTAQARTQAWQFPARVFVSPARKLELLNAPEAELRLRTWLGERGRGICGRWAFGWTAQYFDCDPQSVLLIVEPYLRPSDPHDGALYREAGARKPTRLRAKTGNGNGAIFVAEMEIDTDLVRRRRAESDVAIAEITGRAPLTLETALKAHATDRISGALTVTLETDADGRTTRKISVTEIAIAREDGSHERERTTQTVDWRRLSRSAPPH